ncbi:MAG: phosphatase PAP2 family protein [Candidatus Methanoperedens sp.]|nr:phosphatase PAP2 family protein [Candidatus Methanoperedens sp.]
MQERFKKIILLVTIIALYLGGYRLVQTMNPVGINLEIGLDTYIPLIPEFSVIYLLHIPMIIFAFAFYWNDYKTYRSMSFMLMAVILIALMIYYEFQTEVLRPIIASTDFFSRLTNTIYKYDMPNNAFPSLHVALTTTVSVFVYEKNIKVGMILLPLTFLIILSTMFIKQHVFLDIIGGLMLAFVIFKNKKVFDI